jgi:hypothetical protein
MKRWIAGVGALATVAAFVACGGGNQTGPRANVGKSAPGGSHDPSKWPANDQSRCDWQNKPELEVSETAGPGALKPNVRRVFKVIGDGERRRKVLICREIDTNLDGIKDVVRVFNAKGEAIEEQADRDFDGRIDVWIKFVDGRMAQEQLDTTGDGKPNVWKFYVDGQLQRIRRDRNKDGKPDVWEIYAHGRLERMGVDDDHDGHVDRWDRDEQLKYEAEMAEKKARDAMEAVKDAGAPATDSTEADAGAKKPAEKKPAAKK